MPLGNQVISTTGFETQGPIYFDCKFIVIFVCFEVNPVPRIYVRGFGALPLQGGRNIHPRAYARGVLWYGVNKYYHVSLELTV